MGNLHTEKIKRYRKKKSSHTGKIRYRTRKKALRARYRIVHSSISDGVLHAYHCEFCEGWHLGRKNKKECKV